MGRKANANVPSMKITSLNAKLKKRIIDEIDDGEFDNVSDFLKSQAKKYFKDKDEKANKRN